MAPLPPPRALGVVADEGGAADDGTTKIGGDASLSDDLVPELDFTYFITKNVVFEPILASTRHQASVDIDPWIIGIGFGYMF